MVHSNVLLFPRDISARSGHKLFYIIPLTSMRLRFLLSETGNLTLSTKKSRKKREALRNSSPNAGYRTNTCAHDSAHKTGL